jgi:hypothetical protein
LTVWKDEWHGKLGKEQLDAGDDDDDLFGEKAEAVQEPLPEGTQTVLVDRSSEPPSSVPPSRPQTDTEGDEFDDWDIDEILRAEEEEAAKRSQLLSTKKMVSSDEENADIAQCEHSTSVIEVFSK